MLPFFSLFLVTSLFSLALSLSHTHSHPFPSFPFLGDYRPFIPYCRRYLTRKIGFEAVMRIRCTDGEYIILTKLYAVYSSQNLLLFTHMYLQTCNARQVMFTSKQPYDDKAKNYKCTCTPHKLTVLYTCVWFLSHS